MVSMKNILYARSILALSLWVMLELQGCSSSEPLKGPPVPSVLQAFGKKTITVTAADTGSAVALDPSQELIVRLEVQAQSVGDWRLANLDPELFKVVGPTYEHISRGSMGEDVYTTISIWRFVPSSSGTMTLNFELRRLHSLGPAAQTVSFTVTVK
jgi:predicted secreted protein